MKGRYVLSGIFLLSIFLVAELNVHAEADLDDNSIMMNEIIVDKYDNTNYNNIQDAIDDAPSGSTIYVKKGFYYEILIINKPLTIVGENKDETFLTPTSRKNGYALNIRSSDVTIKGLSINNNGPGIYTTGIKLSSPKVTIENCDIFDSPIGIAIWSSENTISKCRFWGCEDEGIALLGTASAPCTKNTISNCEFYENCDGIELQYSSNNVIRECELYENTHSGIDAIVSSNDNNQIVSCKIYDNSVHGIYLSRSSDNTIKDCSVSNNDDGNIVMVRGSTNNEIINEETGDSVSKPNRRYLPIINFISSLLKNSKLALLLR